MLQSWLYIHLGEICVNVDAHGMHADDKNTDDEEEQNLFMVKFEHHLLENVALQGIRNVRKVFMRQEESTIPNPTDALLGYERRKEWLLDSEGINLAEVLQADNVDATRTLSNHVVEMFEVLGIEAARLSVLKELRAVLEFDGSKVNYRCAPRAVAPLGRRAGGRAPHCRCEASHRVSGVGRALNHESMGRRLAEHQIMLPGIAPKSGCGDMGSRPGHLEVDCVRGEGHCSADGRWVCRHMASLVDIMTARGQIMAITRHGINRRDSSPIAQASFEETVEILFRAATYGEFDHLRGVSENILLGQVCPLGTGSFALVLDNEKLLDAIETMGADVLGLNMGTGAYNPLSGAGASPAAMTPMHFKASPSDFLSPQMSPLGGSDVMFSPTVDGGMSPTSPSYRHAPPTLHLSWRGAQASLHRSGGPPCLGSLSAFGCASTCILTRCCSCVSQCDVDAAANRYVSCDGLSRHSDASSVCAARRPLASTARAALRAPPPSHCRCCHATTAIPRGTC